MQTFNQNYLPKSDVVFSVMFLNKELCEKTLSFILDESIELIDLVAESKNDLRQAAKNSIYFDIKTSALDGRIITLDLQRKYSKDRIRSRTVYYACREIANQKVAHSKYENLKNVVVSFILTEAALKPTSDNKMVQLYDHTEKEVYSQLLTIHEVNMRHITEKNQIELMILRVFFEIVDQQSYDLFVHKYGDTEYGRLLLNQYRAAVSDTPFLDLLGKEDKYMIKLSEEERLMERLEGRLEGKQEERFEVAKTMIKDGVPLEVISKYTALSISQLQNLSKQ